MRSTSVFLSLLAVGVFPAIAAALPDDYTMVYQMRETPTDPHSDLTFRVTLKLSADQADGDDVGWKVTEILIDQYDLDGNVSDTWSELVPFVDTADGLWWVLHADFDNLLEIEFDLPPVVSGTMPAKSPTTEDLDYSFNGEVYSPPPPPGGSPYMFTTAATYMFVLAETEETIGDEEEEPVEPGGYRDPQ